MASTIIVGGGFIGLCTAIALQGRGVPVTLVDAGPPERAASHGNAGWIVPAFSGPVPAPGLVGTSLRWMLRPDSPFYLQPRADLDFVRWLLAFWRRCNQRDHRSGLEATMALNARTMDLFDAYRDRGIAFEEHRDGILYAYHSAQEMERDHAALDLLRPFGYAPPPLLDGAAIREHEPALTDGTLGGYWLAQERHVRPDSLVRGLNAWLAARPSGVRLLDGVQVTGFISSGRAAAGRRITVVETTHGPIAAESVIVCAGAWTPRVVRLADPTVWIPIEAGKGYSLDFIPPPRPVRVPIHLHEARVVVTPLDDRIRLAGTMELSGINHRLVPARIAAISRAGARSLRDWPADASTAVAWTGMRPLTPDGLPVIGMVPGWTNFVVASGHAMLGLTLAPATGEAVADLLTTGRPPEVLQPFSPARFGRR